MALRKGGEVCYGSLYFSYFMIISHDVRFNGPHSVSFGFSLNYSPFGPVDISLLLTLSLPLITSFRLFDLVFF